VFRKNIQVKICTNYILTLNIPGAKFQ